MACHRSGILKQSDPLFRILSRAIMVGRLASLLSFVNKPLLFIEIIQLRRILYRE